MPAPRRRMPRELFETRSHSWHAVGLGEELEAGSSRRALGGLLVALALIAGTMLVYYQREEWLPGYGAWVKAGTALVLMIVGSIAVHWLVRVASPRLFRRLDPATAGTLGFLVRLFAMSLVAILALRVAGIRASTLALGGTITAVVLGLAAQQSLGGIFAGVVLQGTRPFRVGERVRLVGGWLGGQQEGTVSSLGLFYTTLAQGADRIQIPNSMMINLAVVPLREPDKIDLRARFSSGASPRRIEQRLLDAVDTPTRYAPSVALEEVDEDGVVLRISATPLRSGEGSQLAEEVLEALRGSPAASAPIADTAATFD
ncbi:MAG TPA: mechanosensitive ion channel family protein [Solirubrobacterales bacterium]|nr:mechanosensitive ion channel family protein [Solirubrobacterales bacterium]